MTVQDDKSSVYSEGSNRRGPIEAERPKPGPEYELPPTVGAKNHDPTRVKAPAYSIGIPYKRERSEIPGPNAYCYSDRVTIKGSQNAPMYSLQSRPSHKGPEATPGPGFYSSDNVKYGAKSDEPTPRAPIIVGKDRYQWKNWAPAPTKYTVPYTFGTGSVDKSGGKSWSIQKNRDYGGIHYEGKTKGIPCASRYGATDPSIYKKRTPAFSTQGRTKLPVYNSGLNAPGPGAYDPKPVERRSGTTFGTRHSTYVMPVFTMADIH